MEAQPTLQTNSGISLTGVMPAGASLQMQPGELFIGDPPSGFPYPGTTWAGDGVVRPSLTGDGWPAPYVGDPNPLEPFGLRPTQPSVGWPNGVWPTGLPYAIFNPGLSSVTVPTGWTFSVLGDRCTARVDMPGVKAADLTVDIDNGTIKAGGKRFDTNVLVTTQQFIGSDFDPKTAEAVLEAGVLTVTVLKFKEKLVHRVTVAEK